MIAALGLTMSEERIFMVRARRGHVKDYSLKENAKKGVSSNIPP
jgi:hypothetical protein